MRWFIFLIAFLAAAQTGVPLKGSVDILSNDPALYMEKIDLGNGQFQVRSAAAPIWYPDHQTGELKRIDTATREVIEPGDTRKFVADKNIIQYEHKEGNSTFRHGAYILKTQLQALRSEGSVKKSATKVTTNGDGIRYESEVRPGSVKENIILERMPENPTVLFDFDVSAGATITPQDAAGDLIWVNNGGQIVFRMLAPYVFDANGEELQSSYILNKDSYGIVVSPKALEGATFPVTVDPTVSTNQAAQTSYRYTYEELGSNDDHESSYLEFTLPDLTGETITAATCTLTNTDTGSAINPVSIYCDDQADWSNATGQATLDAFSFGATTDSVNFEGTAGTETFSVFGAAGVNGLAKIYGLDASPDPCTIKIFDPNMGATTDSVSTGIRIGTGSGSSIIFLNGSDATNYPYITITYGSAPPAHVPRGSGSVGTIGG